jgi:hypothetical protein
MRRALRASVFSPPPLKFRTAGFPQYGFKQEFNHALRAKRFDMVRGPLVESEPIGPEGQAPCGVALPLPGPILSRGPWLTGRLCCPARSSLTMASSEPLVVTGRLICFVPPALRRRVGPQFKPHVFPYVPSPGPRWTDRVHSTVASPTAVVFAILAEARRPQTPRRLVLAWKVSRGCLKFAFATARTVASPSPTRTFTTELSTSGSLRPPSVMTTQATVNSCDRSRTGKTRSRMGCKPRHKDTKKHKKTVICRVRRLLEFNRRNRRTLRISAVFLGVFVPWW